MLSFFFFLEVFCTGSQLTSTGRHWIFLVELLFLKVPVCEITTKGHKKNTVEKSDINAFIYFPVQSEG